MGSGGVQIKSNGAEIASYGSVTRIGIDDDNQSAIRLSNATLSIES